ncbi:ornithine carbamoyltransferase [Hydrogenovibrio marinus]|uniref:Ornithine carbamoyltransferase n=1 Tax=Hydrogenovibrio marinus TaxID=28885 RepID=A0A066ZX20_HYDMR|nr:ornithine carbamoyltransferase [Hydrogenovibrio marinus]KDN96819.1 ornithine carbamoyltransferase [Hydrogenovibrio marinus]BBN59076.1 ornithine carbamoyltransferase, catabolic [Hydrogenovibrio marinus]
MRHFLTLKDFTTSELQSLLVRATELKAMQKAGEIYEPLKNQTLAMIFEKSSTRTRLSFEIGMTQLGGHALFMSPEATQLGRGEPIEDSAKVISSMADGIMIRTFGHDIVETFAEHSSVPVINALTDDFHPCQLLADMQTYYEHRGSIKDKTVLWVGDGNNMCHSYINAAAQYGFKLRIAAPEGYDPNAELVLAHADRVEIFRDPMEAAENVDLVVTDVWASMGQEEEQKKREKAFKDFQVNTALMQRADNDALFMHCLPAHRGEEVTAEVIDAPGTVVWDEAENRLHAQKALLEFLMARKK